MTRAGRQSAVILLVALAALGTILAPVAQATTDVAKAWGQNTTGQLGDGTSEGPEECASSSACSTKPLLVAKR